MGEHGDRPRNNYGTSSVAATGPKKKELISVLNKAQEKGSDLEHRT